jgi:hypothetical protein
MIVLMLASAYVGLTLIRYNGYPLLYALVGTQHSQGDPEGTQGYDGQFAYFIARDLSAGCQYCDVPAYRCQRILYPLLAWMLALGWPEVVPWTLIGVNVAALVTGTYFTERLLAARGVSPWYALGYGLYGGLVAGLLGQMGIRNPESGSREQAVGRLSPGGFPRMLSFIDAGGVCQGDDVSRCGGFVTVSGVGVPMARGDALEPGGGGTLCSLAGCSLGLVGQPRRGRGGGDGDFL